MGNGGLGCILMRSKEKSYLIYTCNDMLAEMTSEFIFRKEVLVQISKLRIAI